MPTASILEDHTGVNVKEDFEGKTVFVKILMNAKNNQDCASKSVLIHGVLTDVAVKLVLH